LKQGEIGMANLGMFGAQVVEELAGANQAKGAAPGGGAFGAPAPMAPPGPDGPGLAKGDKAMLRLEGGEDGKKAYLADRETEQQKGGGPETGPTPTVRKNFADTALWAPVVTTNAKGEAEVEFTMPEQLTGWKVRVWGMGHGTKVGEGTAEVVTKKDLI